MRVVDGSQGEGGGQILRTAVAIAAARGAPLRVEEIRSRRSSPGLRPQHRTAVRACADICDAALEGDEIGSRTLEFEPTAEPTAGHYHFDVQTAGSATLVAQSMIPPLLGAGGTSRAIIEGGTHTLHAPIWEYLDRTYLPTLARLGGTCETRLVRTGFYPSGGGSLHLEVHPPAEGPAALDLVERGPLQQLDVTSVLAGLPGHIARRELETFDAAVGAYAFTPHSRRIDHTASPGNVLYAEIEHGGHTTLISEMGEKGRPAEDVARSLADRVRAFLESGAAVDPRLADQLVAPLALGAGGRYITSGLTPHCTTQLELVADLLDVDVARTETASGNWRVEIVPTDDEPAPRTPQKREP